jgi:hypothetical protein
MTLRSKFVVIICMLIGLVAGYAQREEIGSRDREIQRLQREASRRRQNLQRARYEANALRAGNVPADASNAVKMEPTSGDPAADERMRSLVRRVYRLKEWIEQSPTRNVPELRFAKDGDWFDVVCEFRQLEREQDLRLAWAGLKRRAQFSFLSLFESALQAYLKTSEGQLPLRIEDLTPFFVCPMDDALLARYEICATGEAPKSGSRVPVIAEKVAPNEEEALEIVTSNGMAARVTSVFPTRRPPAR